MIDRIVTDNFKSIKHADVKLQKVNLLIGPNNSGKSNFLKLFEVIGDHVNDIGDIQEFNFLSREGIKTDVKIYLPEGEIFLNGSHGLLTGDFLKHSFEKHFPVRDFFQEIKKSKIYKISADKVRQATGLDINAKAINKNADNIASFLQIALNRYREVFNNISNDLADLTKEFSEIVLDIVSGNYIKLGLKDNYNQIYWSEELSDGVLYFLSLLCIIHQPNPPKLLLLEEPETGIHPRRIKEIIDLITTLSLQKDIQVIITTHSPLVVDLFEDEPECIFVFEKIDSFSSIKNLRDEIINPINRELVEQGLEPNGDYETTLGQQWVYGFLGGVPA